MVRQEVHRTAITEHPRRLDPNMVRHISTIGLGPFPDLKPRFADVQQQLHIGLNRPNTAKPTRTDGGLLAIRTGIQPITAEAWQAVPTGKRVLVGEFGGTNLNVSLGVKETSGVALSEPLYSTVIPQDKRQVSLATMAARIAEPLRDLGQEHRVNDFGLSIGLMHTGSQEPYGMEAHFVTDTGALDKGVVITDWNELPASERKIVKSVRAKLGPNAGVGVAINDTAGVALDGAAIEKAQQQYGIVLPDGTVAGTGTNKAVDFVNTEVGHATWPDDQVSQSMRKRLIELGYIPAAKDHPEVEYEIGQYLPHRLAAGLRLLSESDDVTIPSVANIPERIEQRALENPALMTDLATGKEQLSEDSSVNELVQVLTQNVMERAAQVYGILFAVEPQRDRSEEERHIPVASLAEGSVLLKGMRGPEKPIKTDVQEIAQTLNGQVIEIFRASGMAGVASLAMVESTKKAA